MKRWPAHLTALFVAAAFVAIMQLWAAQHGGVFLWGDSYPNALHAYWHYDEIERLGLLPSLMRPEFYVAGARAPGLYVVQATLWSLFGLSHEALILTQQLQLALASLFLFSTVYRVSGGMGPSLFAQFLILGSPEAIAQAQNFQLETPSLLAVSAALWSVQLLSSGRRWAAVALGLAMGLGLLCRQQVSAALVVPVIALAAVPVVRALAAQPRRAAFMWLPVPLAALGASLLMGLGQSTVFGYHPLITLATLACAIPLAAALSRSEASVGLGLGAALALGAALSMPWYFSHLDDIFYHLNHSSTADHLNLESAARLIPFQYRVLLERNLGYVTAPLIAVGVIITAARGRGGAPRLALIGLIGAQLLFPLYFHARYSFPLIPFAALLAAFWLPSLGRAATPLLALVCLLPLLRLGGWLTPIPLARVDLTELASEVIIWYEGRPGGQAPAPPKSPGPIPAWLVSTVAPRPGSDWMHVIFEAADRHCSAPPCSVYFHPPPPGFEPVQQLEDLTAARYHLSVVHPHPGLEVSSSLHPRAEVLSVLVFENPQQTVNWAAAHEPLRWTVLERIAPLGSMQALVLRLETPPGAQRQGPRAPFNWGDYAGRWDAPRR